MSINPLQAIPWASSFPPAGLPKNISSGAASFDTILSSLRGAAGNSSTMTGQQAAAEMFRIEMMQTSLSLSGEDEAPSPGPSGMQALEALLAGPALLRQAGQPIQPAASAQAAPAGEPAAAPAPESELGAIGTTAAQYLGTPYRFGGEGEGGDGIDCSSFVQKVFREHQINLPRTAREQSMVGSEVAQADLRKGDLVFFHTYASYPSHVGIYLGDGKMIHASSGKGEVTVSDLNSPYYQSRFMGAKRVA